MPACVASGCANSPGKAVGSNVSFHRFPFHNPSLLAKWVDAVGRNNWSPSKQSCLCSDHFTPRDFLRSDPHSLKETSVPSKFKRLLSTRTRKAEQSSEKELMSSDKDNFKTKARQIQKYEGIAEENDKQVRLQRKQSHSMLSAETPEYLPATKQMKGSQSKKSQTDMASEEIQSTTKLARSNLATKSRAVLPVSESKRNQSANSSAANKPVNNRPKGIRRRKILRESSDESDDEIEVSLVVGKTKQAKQENLAAVRVELDDNEASDDEHYVVPDKWTKNGIGLDKISGVDIVPIILSNSGLGVKKTAEERQMRSSSGIPADKDHVVAVNERRTRYRYIYRVGQCYPEEDDDVPFTKSKLTFVTKALRSQNEKMRALQKKCKELSRSNATLRDILGIPATDANEEQMDFEEQDVQPQAYLIIGSHPSNSAALPSYRFTLTDHSPVSISQSTVKEMHSQQ